MSGGQSFEIMVKGVRCGIHGKNTVLKNVLLPTVSDFVEVAAKDGFTEDFDETGIPQALLRGDLAVNMKQETERGIMLSLAIFVGAGVGTWAIERVCDTVIERAFSPAVDNLHKRMEKFCPNENAILTLETFFVEDRTLLAFVSDCGHADDYENLKKLVPDGMRTAVRYCADHKMPGYSYTYKIVDGQVSESPVISLLS